MTQMRVFHVQYAADGTSWTYHPQPPMPATTSLLVGGWKEIADLRKQFDAVEHFTQPDGHHRFVAQFGEPPLNLLKE